MTVEEFMKLLDKQGVEVPDDKKEELKKAVAEAVKNDKSDSDEGALGKIFKLLSGAKKKEAENENEEEDEGDDEDKDGDDDKNSNAGDLSKKIEKLEKDLESEKKEREKLVKEQQESQKSSREKHVEKLIKEEGVQKGRIADSDDEKAKWKKRMTGADAEEWENEFLSLAENSAVNKSDRDGDDKNSKDKDGKAKVSPLSETVDPEIAEYVGKQFKSKEG